MSADIERLAKRLQNERASQEEVHQQELEIQRRDLLGEERRRVEKLRATVERWYKAMSAADYPGLELILGDVPVGTRTVRKGLFGKIEEKVWETQELPAWMIGWNIIESHSSYYTEKVDCIFLVADGRLVCKKSEEESSLFDYELREYELVPGFRYRENNDIQWNGFEDPRGYRDAELCIPENLKRLAQENGVEWAAEV